MEDYEDYFLENCIIAEERKLRPTIGESQKACPFCKKNEELLENIHIEVSVENEEAIRIVANKYPIASEEGPIYGIHDVVIDTLNHVMHPKEFSIKHWCILLQAIQARWNELCKNSRIKFIQIFKNHGIKAGASIYHSHWQIIGLEELPYGMMHQYIHYNQRKTEIECYLCQEQNNPIYEYLIKETDYWYIIAPPRPMFPYELWIIPKQHRKHYGELTEQELKDVGKVMKEVLGVYDYIVPNSAFNICFMSGGLECPLNYHFYIKTMLRKGTIAGFEIATHCAIGTKHPKKYSEEVRKLLR